MSPLPCHSVMWGQAMDRCILMSCSWHNISLLPLHAIHASQPCMSWSTRTCPATPGHAQHDESPATKTFESGHDNFTSMRAMFGVMSRSHGMPCHAMPRDVMFTWNAMPCYATWCHVHMDCHAMLCHVMSCSHGMPCHDMPRDVMFTWNAMPWWIMYTWNAMPWYATWCHVHMECYAMMNHVHMECHAMICHVMSC